MLSYAGHPCTCIVAPGCRNGKYPLGKSCGHTSRRTFSAFRDPGKDQLATKPSNPRKGASQRLPGSRALSSRSAEGDSESLVISPGYTMTRSKGHIAVMLEEAVCGGVSPLSEVKPPPVPSSSLSVHNELQPDYREDIIEALQEQIAKLTALLEQEATEHQQTQRRLTKELEDRVTELQKKNEEEVRSLREKHATELHSIQEEDSAKLAQEKAEAEKKFEDLQNDCDFLHSSFKTYKESLLEELNEVWLQKETRWKETFEQEKFKEMGKQKQAQLEVFETERQELLRNAQEEVSVVQQSHARQLDETWQKYKEVMQESQMLNKLNECLQTDIAEKQEAIVSVNTLLQRAQGKIGKLKSQISELEKSFELRVSKVEAKYRHTIQSSMMENADLRRKFIAKSEQLFSERTKESFGTRKGTAESRPDGKI
ncbi:hypothetical protein FKM82_015781 [Ascaphus truei]